MSFPHSQHVLGYYVCFLLDRTLDLLRMELEDCITKSCQSIAIHSEASVQAANPAAQRAVVYSGRVTRHPELVDGYSLLISFSANLEFYPANKQT
nr:hypothetical protein Itr_chr14CG30990 [Ipomoea trifida]